jgi:hypothetical protein
VHEVSYSVPVIYHATRFDVKHIMQLLINFFHIP